MQFYDRRDEIKALETIYHQAYNSSKMTVISGRRRIGKTMLALQFVKNKQYLYFFIAKKAENLLCSDFIKLIRDRFDVPIIGEINRFIQVFELILQLAQKERLVLIIDEFQEFYTINPSVYSEIQNLWDQYKSRSKIQLILIGSVYSLMVKIFEKSSEPLFGRADSMIFVKPFTVTTIKEILQDHNGFTIENLFSYYIITGGIPKYLEIFIDNRIFETDQLIDLMIQKDSYHLNEGKNLLIEEFGNKYGTYFSILELISSGKTDRSAIESILQKNIGGYLDRLESVYGVIQKIKPFNAKPMGRIVKYKIKDNFLNFWFRFIHKNRSAIETGNFHYIRQILKRDFKTYSGLFLEKLFHELIAGTSEYNRIGNYWEKGNLNEIDLIAANDMQKTMLVADIKINPDKLDIGNLKTKSKAIVSKFNDYTIDYKGLSIENINDYL